MGNGRLRPGELLAAAGGVALLVVMALDWYGVRTAGRGARRETGVTASLNAWQAFDLLDVIIAFAACAGIAVLVLNVVRRSPAIPVAAEVLVTTLAALVLLAVLYRILDQPGPDDTVGVEPGAYLGALATFAIAAGGFVAMRDESGRAAPEPTVEHRPPPPAAATAGEAAATPPPERSATPRSLEPAATPRADPLAQPASADPSISRREGS